MRRGYRDSVAFTLVVGILSLIGGLVMVVVILASAAPDKLILPALLAVAPVGPLVGCYLWLDRYEPEPRTLLAGGLAWGAFVATSVALVFQLVLSAAGASEYVVMVVGAPVTEEATKGFFLLLLLWWRRHELDGVLDGIIYAGMVGIGFAFVENIIYLVGADNEAAAMGVDPTTAVWGTFIMRCLFSPFAHPFFTAFTGIGVGLAIAARNPAVRVLAPVLGYCVAVLAHAAWNFGATQGARFLLVYAVLMAPAFLLTAALAIWRRVAERRMLTAALLDASMRGLLPHSDIGWLVDLRGRKQARQYAFHMGGPRGRAAMREYQQAAVELGFLHHRFLRGTAPRDFAARGQTYVMRMNAVRPYISFPGQVVPTR